VRLFGKNLNNSEIGRRLKVSNQTVSRWRKQYQQEGKGALRRAGRSKRLPCLSEADKARLVELLVQGPEPPGYETPLWTCPRVAHLIEKNFGVEYHPGHVWRILRQLNWSVQQPVGRALERNEALIADWKQKRWPEIKKKAQAEGRTIVSVDESGLSRRPHRRRTWAPRGQTPVIQFHFNWKTLSAIAGLTLWNFHFQIFEQAMKSEQIIEFLRHLLRYIDGDILLVWDRLPRTAEHHELPNVCPKTLWDVSEGARRSLRRMRRRPRLITAFWKQASLFD
jgi:transposase